METLTNVEVGYVKLEPKIKEGKYGEYKIWDFTLSGDKDRWFGYIEKNNLVPEKGMKILVLKYESQTNVKDGKTYYNNYVKELTPDSNWYSGKEPEIPHQKPPSVAGSTFSTNRGSDIGPMTMWGKYIGEVISALIGKGLIGKGLDDAAKDAMETFADCCIVFERQYSNVIELPKPEKEPEDDEDPNLGWTFTQDTPDDEPPFPDEPPPY